MSQGFEITFFNRYTQQKEIEKVYGDSMVKFAYGTKLGRSVGSLIASRFLSQCYGFFQDLKISSKKVTPFVEKFSINLEDYEKGQKKNETIENSYISFNDFFIREFKPGKREFLSTPKKMPAFSEARYFGHESVTDDLIVPVKGNKMRAIDLIGNKKLAQDFIGGPFLIARLCPVDYHRYHYPDNGRTLENYLLKGDFHSVNPLALKYKQDILIENERRVSVIETENFGKLAFVEVGATCVGKIVQTHDEQSPFKRGDEKGYFLFGGSTVIVYGEPGKWKPSSDILENTELGIETYIHLGDEVANLIH